MFKFFKKMKNLRNTKKKFEDGVSKKQMTEYKLKPVYNKEIDAYELHLITDTVIKLDSEQMSYLKENNFIAL